MTNVVLINESLKDKRIVTGHSAALGDNVHVVEVIPQEFRSLAAFYPVLISKDSNSGQYGFVSILGFENGENLFLKEDQWDCPYIPATIRRQPFTVLPRAGKNDAGQDVQIPSLGIDLDNPRVSDDEGEMLFNEEDKPTEYLEQMKKMLSVMISGARMSRDLLTKLEELGLIESLNIGVTFADGKRCDLRALYTIGEKKLGELSDEQVLDLHKTGFLAVIYQFVASQAQIGALVQRKNAGLPAAE
jgi:hypothetical protein